MRKLLLVNIAVAALGAAALMPGRADATTLGAAAGLRSAVDGIAPVEEVQWRYRYHRRHAYYPYRYGYRSYAFYPRFHHRRYWRHHRGWW